MSTPLYLDIPGQVGPAFAWYHAATDPKDLGVVLCPPIGSEYMQSYRSLRTIAERIAALGIAVLRIDYHGTGDSAGSDFSPGRVGAWLATIDAGVEQLRAITGVADVALVGVRAGAVLAGAAASRREDIAALVTWGAMRSGSAYVREQRMLRLSEAKNLGAEAMFDGEGAVEESAGFSMTGETIAALGALDLTKLGKAPAPRALVIGRDEMAPDEKVKKGLEALGVAVMMQSWPGLAGMLVAPHYSVAPLNIADGIVAFLGGGPGQPATTHPRGEVTATWSDTPAPGITRGVEEQSMRFGPGKRLFGIVTHAQGAPRRAPAIVLANTGANHHVGPNRMYVELARRLAMRGFRVLRMDVSTIGDSDAVRADTHNQPYTTEAIGDLRRGADELEHRWGVSRVAVLGLCSGAYVAFQTSLANTLPIEAQVLVNPQTFYWKEGDTLDVAPGKIYEQTRHVRRQMFRAETWKRFVTGRVEYGTIVSALAARAKIVATDLAKSAARRAGMHLPNDVASDLRRIAERPVDTLIVFSEGDPGIDYLKRNAGSAIDRLQRRDNFRVEKLERADHTFTATDAQERLFAVIDRHFDRLWPYT